MNVEDELIKLCDDYLNSNNEDLRKSNLLFLVKQNKKRINYFKAIRLKYLIMKWLCLMLCKFNNDINMEYNCEINEFVEKEIINLLIELEKDKNIIKKIKSMFRNKNVNDELIRELMDLLFEKEECIEVRYENIRVKAEYLFDGVNYYMPDDSLVDINKYSDELEMKMKKLN